MTTMHAKSSAVPMSADAQLRVTVESTATPVVDVASSKVSSEEKNESKTEMAQSSLTQVLSSLAETRKYVPNQVYAFLDSMEGKTLDDLRVEAMNMANKAQEEAKKRTDDVKAIVDNANNKVLDAADMARAKTTDIANDVVQKSKDIVQPPLDRTKEATKSVAMKVNDTTTGLAMKGLNTAQRLAMRGYTIASNQLTPIVQPVAARAVEYLPMPAKDFLEQNIEGKSMNELKNIAILATRKNLLSAKDEVNPDLPGLAVEVKDATLSGELLKNAIGLSEKAADKVFGQVEIPKDVGALRRMYNLSMRVTWGMRDYAYGQANNMNEQAKGMITNRVKQIQSLATQRSNQVTSTISPVLERIGAMPVVPDFIYRYLRGEMPKDMGESGAMSGTSAGLNMDKSLEKTKTVATTVPTTSVRVDIVGTKPGEAQISNVSGSTASFGGANMSTNLKDMKASSDPIGNTNAQGMGKLGAAGMGVTTTGSEDKTSESEPQITEEGEKGSSKKGKKGKM